MAKTSSLGGLLHFLGTGLTLCERGEEEEGRGDGRGEDWGWLWTLELSRLQSEPAIQDSFTTGISGNWGRSSVKYG